MVAETQPPASALNGAADAAPAAEAKSPPPAPLSISPTLSGIASLYTECDDTGSSDDSEEELHLPPAHVYAASAGGAEDAGLSSDVCDDDAQRCAPGDEEMHYDALQQEQGSEGSDAAESEDAESEEDAEALRVPATPQSRYSGHPLGVPFLEWQQQMVQRENTTDFWTRAAVIQQRNQWTQETSMARAKVLVSEARRLERQQLEQQRDWLRRVNDGRHTPTCRFGEAFARPNHACFPDKEELADILQPGAGAGAGLPMRMYAGVTERKLRDVDAKWRCVGRQVAADMAAGGPDAFPAVIRNLSTMRMFVQGDQAAQYAGVSEADQQLRLRRRQDVLDRVRARGDGYFLKDALDTPVRGAAGDLDDLQI